MELEQILKKIGLNNKEINIYLALIELGAGTVSEISRKTGLHRPTIYKTLPSLKEKSLISFVSKGKRKVYMVESPEKLKGLITQATEELEEVLPILKQRFKHIKGNTPSVKYLEGKEGLTFVFEDLVTSLKKGDVFFRYSARRNFNKKVGYLPKKYRERRDKKQLERLVITSEKSKNRYKRRLERSVKFVPARHDLFDQHITQIIYGDKVAIIDYNTETAVIMENPFLAEFQKKLFMLLYNKL